MKRDRRFPQTDPRGFTLVEVLVVMAVVALLLSLVAPRYFASVDQAREAALKSNLRSMRDAIDKHVADTGKYPASLDVLVKGRYLREVPIDPITERTDTWSVVAHPDRLTQGVYDVRSGAAGVASKGEAYASW